MSKKKTVQPVGMPVSPTVEALGLKRVRDGWLIVTMHIPEHLADEFITKTDGPHDLTLTMAKMADWATRKGYGA